MKQTNNALLISKLQYHFFCLLSTYFLCIFVIRFLYDIYTFFIRFVKQI